MAITLTPQDRQALAICYPKLNCSLLRRTIWGTLDVAHSFDQDKKEIIHDNSASNYICDSYEIRIEFTLPDKFGFPKVYEESGIIRRFAQEHGIDLEDLHLNKEDDDSCCLGIFPEYQWQGVAAYIRDKVVPFFYWQSYRRVNGKSPWESYSHGNSGIVEAMTMSLPNVAKGRSRNKICPCGSGRKYKKCCLGRDEILKSKLS